MKAETTHSLSNVARYNKYRLYRLHIDNEEQVNILAELERKSDSYVLYGTARKPNQNLILMVAAAKIAEFHDLLERFKISWELLVMVFTSICDFFQNYLFVLLQHSNLQELIDLEKSTISPIDTKPEHFDWIHYHHLDTIYRWLDNLAVLYPFVSILNLGKSYESNDVKGIKIEKTKNKPSIFVEAGTFRSYLHLF